MTSHLRIIGKAAFTGRVLLWNRTHRRQSLSKGDWLAVAARASRKGLKGTLVTFVTVKPVVRPIIRIAPTPRWWKSCHSSSSSWRNSACRLGDRIHKECHRDLR